MLSLFIYFWRINITHRSKRFLKVCISYVFQRIVFKIKLLFNKIDILSLFIGLRSDPKFLKSNPMIVLFVFFIISISIISIEFSNLLISSMSLRISEEKNNDLKGLINNEIRLITPSFIKPINHLWRKNTNMNMLVNQSIEDNNMWSLSENKTQQYFWMEKLLRGDHAILIYEVLFKMRIVLLGSLFEDMKIIHLEEMSKVMQVVLPLNRKLGEEFCHLFKFR